MNKASAISLKLTKDEATKILLALAVISEDMTEDSKTTTELHDKIKKEIQKK